MNWLKNNYFKIGILILIFVVPYFLYYVPIIQPKAQLQKNTAICNEKGGRFSESFKQKSMEANSNIISFVVPQLHFSQQENVCLSENGYVFPDHGGEGIYMQIANLDDGTLVLKSPSNIYEQPNPSQNLVTYDDFVLKAKDIMNK